jgi:hypothetical protein
MPSPSPAHDPRAPADTATPVNDPAAMDVAAGAPLRDECWKLIGPPVRDRIRQRSGEIIEWWAGVPEGADGRPIAVVVGRNAAVFAEPTLNMENRPVYVLAVYELDFGSIREGPVEHRPSRDSRLRPRLKPRAGAATPAAAPPVGPSITGLTASARGVLGNLPRRAQELLQAPFLEDEVLRCEWHYEGSATRLDMFGIVLAGASELTLATGTKQVPPGHSETTAHWSLRCYRATVIRRSGT